VKRIIEIIRYFLFLSLIACTGCFEGNSWTDDSRSGGWCGTVDNGHTEILAVETPHIFKAQCATCHTYRGDATGPKMKGILDRVPSEDWLRSFITNQDSLVAIGDSATLKIMDWSPVKWNHHLSDADKRDLDTLMSFITQ